MRILMIPLLFAAACGNANSADRNPAQITSISEPAACGDPVPQMLLMQVKRGEESAAQAAYAAVGAALVDSIPGWEGDGSADEISVAAGSEEASLHMLLTSYPDVFSFGAQAHKVCGLN